MINRQENLAKLAASGVAYKDRAAERRIQNPGFVDPTAPGIAVRRHAGEEEDDEPYAADAVSCRWVLGRVICGVGFVSGRHRDEAHLHSAGLGAN